MMNGELREDFERLTSALVEQIRTDSVDADWSEWIEQQVRSSVPVMTGDLMTAMADNPNLAQRYIGSANLDTTQVTLADVASKLYHDELYDQVTNWLYDELSEYEDCPGCDLACHEDDLIQDPDDEDGDMYCPECTRRRTIARIAGSLDGWQEMFDDD